MKLKLRWKGHQRFLTRQNSLVGFIWSPLKNTFSKRNSILNNQVCFEAIKYIQRHHFSSQSHHVTYLHQSPLEKLVSNGVVNENGDLTMDSLSHQIYLLHKNRPTLPLKPTNQPTRFASVLMPLVNTSQGASLLLTQRSPNLRSHAGQMCFPGGRVEPSDGSHYYAALRETYEEIGFLPNFFTYLTTFPPLFTRDEKTEIRAYLAFSVQTSLPSLGTGEVKDLFYVPLTSFLNPKHQKISRFRNTDLLYVEFNIDKIPRIWGITAVILNMYLNSICPDALISIPKF